MLKTELVKRLETFLNEHESLLGEPATKEQITEAELKLGLKFSEDYVDFITKFGGAFGGIDIHAFCNGSLVGKETVVELTEWLRKNYSAGDPREEEALQSIAISDDGSGNPIIINKNGEVVIYYHDCDEREVLAPSLNQFIEDNFVEW